MACFALHSVEPVEGGSGKAVDLWRAAGVLYAKDEKGGGKYGWASLRAAALHGLSQFRGGKYSEASLVSLLSLLTELSPSSDEGGLGSRLDNLEVS